MATEMTFTVFFVINSRKEIGVCFCCTRENGIGHLASLQSGNQGTMIERQQTKSNEKIERQQISMQTNTVAFFKNQLCGINYFNCSILCPIFFISHSTQEKYSLSLILHTYKILQSNCADLVT